MNVEKLKAEVEAYREKLKGKSGRTCISSENGPVGISLIDAIVTVLESQQQQIDDIEKKVEASHR